MRAEVLCNPYVLGDGQQTGQISEVAASSSPSRRPTRGWKCYATPALSGVPNKADKIRSGCLTPPFTGAHKGPKGCVCILGGPQTRGQNQKVPASHLPARGPARGRKWYVSPALSGVPNKRDKIRSGGLTLAFLGAQKKGAIAARPVPSRGTTRGRKCYGAPAFSRVPNKGDRIRSVGPPLSSVGPTRGRKCYATRAFSGVPNKGDKIRNGCLTLAFLGAHKRAEVLRNPCVFGGPQKRGQNQKWLPHPYLLGGPQEGKKPCVLGRPKTRG